MNTGKAYGFFNCRASKEAIEKVLPTVNRGLAQPPSTLELALIEGLEKMRAGEFSFDPAAISLNSKLNTVIEDARQAGLRYAIEATLSGADATNKTAADFLSVILNRTYQTHLYQEGEPFHGGIVYEENGEYVFRE